MMYSGDEDYGDEITSGIFPDGMRDDLMDMPDAELDDDGEYFGEMR